MESVWKSPRFKTLMPGPPRSCVVWADTVIVKMDSRTVSSLRMAYVNFTDTIIIFSPAVRAALKVTVVPANVK